jgi:hypothetical protein
MAWRAQVGSTLLIPSGGCDHLHIVCSDPMDFRGYATQSCLLVNISSVVPKCDTTVVLDAGDHPFVVHPSFVFYKKAFVERASTLEKWVVDGVYKQHQSADRSLVKRVVACMDASDFTPGGILQVAKVVWNGTTW